MKTHGIWKLFQFALSEREQFSNTFIKNRGISCPILREWPGSQRARVDPYMTDNKQTNKYIKGQ